MGLTAQDALIKETANKAYNCGENVAAALNNLMDTLHENKDGLKGVAGDQFSLIQAELYEQVDRLNKDMDNLAETLISTGDALTTADLDLEQSMKQAWGDGASDYSNALGNGQIK